MGQWGAKVVGIGPEKKRERESAGFKKVASSRLDKSRSLNPEWFRLMCHLNKLVFYHIYIS